MTRSTDSDVTQQLADLLKRQQDLQETVDAMAADLQAFREEMQRTSTAIYRNALRGEPPEKD